jgi:hypothetical protein
LYEGTPGGGYDPENTYFGTDQLKSQKLSYDYYKGDVYRDKIRWMYVGTNSSKNVMYFVHQTNDNHLDMVSLLGNSVQGINSLDGMTVFAFGRGEGVSRYLKGRNTFIIGMFPKKIDNDLNYQELSKFIARKIRD